MTELEFSGSAKFSGEYGWIKELSDFNGWLNQTLAERKRGGPDLSGVAVRLAAKFTDAAGVEVNPALVVGTDGKETRLAMTSANATATTRKAHVPRMGLPPETRQPPIPTTTRPLPRSQPPPAPIKNVASPNRFRNGERRASQLIPLTPA